MKAYKRGTDGRWYIIDLVPYVKTRADIIQEWVEADILPLLYNPGTTAMKETVDTYLSVSDEEIEQCKMDYIKFKNGKHNEQPRKLKDIPVHPNAPRKQYVSPKGYRLGDLVLLKNGKRMTLEKVENNGVFRCPGGLGLPMSASEDDITEVLAPAPVLKYGDRVRFLDPFMKTEVESTVEGFVVNHADVFVRIVRNGRKVPITMNPNKLTKVQRRKTA